MIEYYSSVTTSEFELTAFLANLTQRAGIYKMLDVNNQIIYIGKAKNLKHRVNSYFKSTQVSIKQRKMLDKVTRIEITVTQSEVEALLLESQQIKQYQPRYNICLRDDKSYPYIFISTTDPFPRVQFYRGAKTKAGRYFGPYPSANAVKETLKWLPSIFPVRQCEDNYYRNRSRPCLQYQIHRCTAPCVGFISESEYQQDVQATMLFLQGKGHNLLQPFVDKMQQASAALEFEQASYWRDKISRLRTILEKQAVDTEPIEADIWACVVEAGLICVQVFMIRAGQTIGNHEFFPKMNTEVDATEVLTAFIPQYYLQQPIPDHLWVNHPLTEVELLTEWLSKQAQHRVTLHHQARGQAQQWLQMAITNVHHALATRLTGKQQFHQRLVDLQQRLQLATLPQRLECIDISHTQGQQTVASLVVLTADNGLFKSAYRRFNIEGIRGGDDYAAIYQTVFRRFKRWQSSTIAMPDILFVDGGQGQVQQAQNALNAVELNNVMIIGIAKGLERKVGMEKLVFTDKTMKVLPRDCPALLLIQQLRDEAHRFAITHHRRRRNRVQQQSILENIVGLGAKKRQQLLQQFGGLAAISSASIDALTHVKGIGLPLAQRIYDTFHPDNGCQI